MLNFLQRFGRFKTGHNNFILAMMPTLKKAVRLLHDFIHEAAILRKGLLFYPPQKSAADPSSCLWTIARSLQVPFHDSQGQSLYWASLSLFRLLLSRLPGWHTEEQNQNDYTITPRPCSFYFPHVAADDIQSCALHAPRIPSHVL